MARAFCDVAARVLATYLVPGCVGSGVRLGSESSSNSGAVWISGHRNCRAKIESKNQQMEIPGIEIRSAQNVGKVNIAEKTRLPSLFGVILDISIIGQANAKCLYVCLMSPLKANSSLRCYPLVVGKHRVFLVM